MTIYRRNSGHGLLNYQAGDRIAQLVFYRYAVPERVDVAFEDLSVTSRIDGFGSTGVK